MKMCLETAYTATANYTEYFFDALKPGQNEKSYIFQEIGIPKIHVRLFQPNSTSSLMPCIYKNL